jgi:copper chaperone CopZ
MATQTVRMPVRGMTCGNCARSVQRKLAGTLGVVFTNVDLDSGSATVEYDPEVVRPAALAEAVRQLGYEVPVE